MATLAAEIKARLKEDRKEMQAMLGEVNDMSSTNYAEASTSANVDRQFIESSARLLQQELSQSLERVLQSMQDAFNDNIRSLGPGSDRSGGTLEVKEELAMALAECLEVQRLERSRFAETIEYLSSEVDTRIKKEVELVEASRTCAERALLQQHLERIRDFDAVDAHKAQLLQLVKDIGASLEEANASNRKIDTAVNTIAKRLEETYKEQISVLRQEIESNHKLEMGTTANELQAIFVGATFAFQLAGCAPPPHKSAGANEAWDDERRELLEQIRHLRLSAAAPMPAIVRECGIPKQNTRSTPQDMAKLKKAMQGTHELWSSEACAPSRDDLLRIVGAIEDALLEGKDVADVYNNEAKRLIDRLPILKLIAQREYLLCKRGLGADGATEDEVKQVDEEILEAMDVYEEKYEEAFVVGDQIYRDILSK
ncbi:hypothetical protein FOZ61_001992 [Perkinsus olseni]|uniref:Uncharacterized protein n=1 Tax=Perkinsus olseni TaxID=32597 RepID=A0A7J6LUX8_PEROL|nr:hypothetical protein FOZ61_001992 [Perkinsus olseni]KAF4666168.1 hypothetical protein FOL46_003245 [Perkinsus olseni]